MIPNYEFKLFVALILTFFIFILTRTQSRDKSRPILLLVMYFGYLSFQVVMMVDFYPLTSFQKYSFPDDKAARYFKMKTVLEDGSRLDAKPDQILPFLKHDRVWRFAWDSLRDTKDANKFATYYAQAYEKRFSKQGKPKIAEVHFEDRKWFWEYEPHDPDHGFVLKRSIGHPLEDN